MREPSQYDWLLLVLLFLLLGVLLSNTQRPEPDRYRVVVAQEFQLVDTSGAGKAIVYLREGQPVLSIVGRSEPHVVTVPLEREARP